MVSDSTVTLICGYLCLCHGDAYELRPETSPCLILLQDGRERVLKNESLSDLRPTLL